MPTLPPKGALSHHSYSLFTLGKARPTVKLVGVAASRISGRTLLCTAIGNPQIRRRTLHPKFTHCKARALAFLRGLQLAGLFISSLALASQSKEAQLLASPAAEPLPLARVLTISGGISLGACEAGYNWAFARCLKQFYNSSPGKHSAGSLAAVTGASAGNINAFLSAIAWCQSKADRFHRRC